MGLQTYIKVEQFKENALDITEKTHGNMRDMSQSLETIETNNRGVPIHIKHSLSINVINPLMTTDSIWNHGRNRNGM